MPFVWKPAYLREVERRRLGLNRNTLAEKVATAIRGGAEFCEHVSDRGRFTFLVDGPEACEEARDRVRFGEPLREPWTPPWAA